MESDIKQKRLKSIKLATDETIIRISTESKQKTDDDVKFQALARFFYKFNANWSEDWCYFR